MKNYTIKNFVEHLKKSDFPNYKTYSFVDMTYLDFVTKLMDVIDSLCPSEKIRIKGNTKPQCDSEVISIVKKRDACYKKFESPGLETDKDILTATKEFIKTTVQKKKGCFFKTSCRKIRKILKNYGKPRNLQD